MFTKLVLGFIANAMINRSMKRHPVLWGLEEKESNNKENKDDVKFAEVLTFEENWNKLAEKNMAEFEKIVDERFKTYE